MREQAMNQTEYFGLESKWIQTRAGEETHYHEIGTGTPVIFLHGSGAGVSAAANWWLNLPTIGENVRAIAPDLIGFGQTVVPNGTEYGITAWVKHIVRLADALELDKVWLVGNSLGGWVAFQFAVLFPDRLAGIVSMGTGGAPRTKALESHAKPEFSIGGIRQALIDFVVDPSLVEDELVEARFHAASSANAQQRFQEVIQARDRDREDSPLDFEVLSKLQVPVLLIHGRQDRVIPLSRSEELAEVIPSSDMHVFSNCGHWSQVERARDFNSLVQNYIVARS